MYSKTIIRLNFDALVSSKQLLAVYSKVAPISLLVLLWMKVYTVEKGYYTKLY